MSHLSLLFASRSLTQPWRLRENKMVLPSAAKRGNQSTLSPLVICVTSEPSVFIVNKSWLPMRELDQTMMPCAFSPTFFIDAASSASGASWEPLGGAPVRLEQALSTAMYVTASVVLAMGFKVVRGFQGKEL